MKWFFDLAPEELREDITDLGLKKFVADQLSLWILKKNLNDPENWRNIGKVNREILLKSFNFEYNRIVKVKKDKTGTEKFLFELIDGNRVESVLINEKDHYTFCISSQVGCPLGCKFCATGYLGFKRDLSPGEIISQIQMLRKELGDYSGKINLVFMGMGEPLLNYENLKKALLIITDEKGIGMSPKRITISTAGILRNLKNLENDFPNIKISFSLNGSSNDQRESLMPVSKKEKLDNILNYFRSKERKHRITFEYVLISGINDTLQDAEKVTKLLRGIPSKINIIPYNENNFSDFKPPTGTKVNEFAEFFAKKGFTVMVRWSKGKDIGSACGQLAGE